jgi:predicted nucleotidyltransferase
MEIKMETKREQDIIKNVINVLKKYFNPDKIILFGSRAKNPKKSKSDFDIAIDIKKPSIEKRRELGREIDEIAGLYKVDIIYLKSVEEEFRDIVSKTGRVIYGK